MRHITFASPNMSISAEKCSESALKWGCSESTIYTPDDIDKEFYEKNKAILEQERGAGYWLWKPYFIYKALQEGDVIYTDAGLLFEKPVGMLTDQMQGDIMLFGNRWRHGDWCKMDVLYKMGCKDYADGEQLQASCLVIRKTDETMKFIRLWLQYCQLPGFIDDSPSELPNVEGFREARHDQAILTNLAYLKGLHFHWWPAPYNVRHKHKYTETYPVIFMHHRYRNEDWVKDPLGIKKRYNLDIEL